MLTKERIAGARRVVKLLHRSPDRLENELAELATLREGITDADRSKWLRDNWDSQEFADAVIMNTTTDVLAHMFTMSFFQEVSLNDDQWPIIKTGNRDGKFKCRYIGEGGLKGKPKHQYIERLTHQQHLVERYSTEEVEYKLIDLQTGNVAEADRVMQELAYEHRLGIDGLGRTILDAVTKSSGLRATLNLHKSIVAANVPDKNYMDLSGEGDAGKWNIEKLKQILEYFERFSSDVELDGTPLKPTVIYMSSQNIRDIWDFVDLVSGFDSNISAEDPKNTVPNSAREGIWTSGTINRLFGHTVLFVTRNTIAKGDAYVASNKPIGWYFHKPGMAELHQDLRRRENKGLMSKSVVHVFVSPDEWSYRMVKVKL